MSRPPWIYEKPFPKPATEALLAAFARLEYKPEITMDKDTYDRGLAMRRKVLGDAYVDRALTTSMTSIGIFNELSPSTAGVRPGATHAHAARALNS